ncbi:MAG: hypothetical protein ACQEQU_00615 [Spirochaetota bacterium]
MKKVLCVLLALVFCISPVLAQENGARTVETEQEKLDELNAEMKRVGKALGLGLAVFGATAGIGALVSSGLEGMARQPEASDELQSAMNAGILACCALGVVAAFTISAF